MFDITGYVSPPMWCALPMRSTGARPSRTELQLACGDATLLATMICFRGSALLEKERNRYYLVVLFCEFVEGQGQSLLKGEGSVGELPRWWREDGRITATARAVKHDSR